MDFKQLRGTHMKKLFSLIMILGLTISTSKNIECSKTEDLLIVSGITIAVTTVIATASNACKGCELLKNHVLIDEIDLLNKAPKKVWNLDIERWPTKEKAFGDKETFTQSVFKSAKTWSKDLDYITSPFYLVKFAEQVSQEIATLKALKYSLIGAGQIYKLYKSALKNTLFILLKNKINLQAQKIDDLLKRLELILEIITEDTEFGKQRSIAIADYHQHEIEERIV